jgi:hypothetical protein
VIACILACLLAIALGMGAGDRAEPPNPSTISEAPESREVVMPGDQTTDDKVLQIVRDRWAGANVKRVEITDRYPEFIRGSLYAVSIYDAVDQEHQNFVYVSAGQLRLFQDMNELAIGVGRISEPPFWIKDPAVMSGAIAVMLILFLGIMVVVGRANEIPEWLYAGLPVILGYYFGRETSKGA